MAQARIYEPVKPRVSDSIEKWNEYRTAKKVWDDALAKSKREKEAKTLMSRGDFAGADKVLKGSKGKGGKKTATKKRRSI